jgi:hypothetical protein
MCGYWEKNTSLRNTERRPKSMCVPLIDWNGNGQVDPADIAVSLAMAEEEEMDNEDNENEDPQ